MKKRFFIAVLLVLLLLAAAYVLLASGVLPVELPFELPFEISLELPEISIELPFELPFDLPFLAQEEETEVGETVIIYRVASEDAADGGDLICEETCPKPEGDSLIDGVLALFAAESGENGMACALPDGVTIEGWSQEKAVVTLTFSESFLALTDMEQTVTAFCAALTLCALDDVESVTVAAGGQTVFSGLMPEDALLRDTDTDPYVRQLRLYFADADGRYLISEYHSLTLDEDTSPERYVIEELLRGPNNGELQQAIPEGTELISCETTDGVCAVNLSEEFYVNRPDTAAGERLAVYSIVNSLTSLSQVDSVVILVEGETLESYVYLSLADDFTKYDEVIGPVSESQGEIDADLYLALPGLEDVAALPFRGNLSDYQSRAEAVLQALLAAAEPGYPSLFSGSGTVTDLTVSNGACTVSLSQSFFASLSEDARAAAIRSIAATLCALDEINAVLFTIGGGEAIFDGTDWSGPWTAETLG
ncbi:MAG: GerMN domain-containing protein [Oscillospiraceae bacterium]|nr:GerMN domain-containing protein [Oscillospiraceae bacterium]